jgi:NADP-dependent 3-hydroxy acid dehydrogenase YdfG
METLAVPSRASWLLMASLTAGRQLARRRREAAAYDVRDRTALVTGGSRGLGLVLARHLGARGARVAVCARGEDDLARARRDLEARCIRALALRCDVTDRAQVIAMV